MYYGNGTQRYRETDIGTMSPEKIIVMLYERAIRDLEQAGEALGRGERGEVNRLVLHSQTIIAELRAALDHRAGGEVAANLESLYEWLFREHLALLAAPEARRLDDCVKVLTPLLEAWRAIPAGSAENARRLAAAAAGSGPVPANRYGEPGGPRDRDAVGGASEARLLSVTV
ncbi:MAG: flagellar export chaperone FliS [Candidatus Krumholzibacteriia bacterium]